MRLNRPLDGSNQPDMLSLELELERHLKEPRGAWVACVEPVSKARRHLMAIEAFDHQRFCRLLKPSARPHQRQPAVEETHARLDVSTMVGPKSENTGRHAILE